MSALIMRKLLLRLSVLSMALLSSTAWPDDIDIFMGVQGVDAQNPNVLIILDNTSNWSRQSQHWPDRDAQGQSEVVAIKEAIKDLDDTINIGLMEFTTGGTANQNGGFIRHHISPLTDASKTALNNKLDTIFSDINDPAEKRNSNTSYGNLMYDVYNYLTGGTQVFSGAGTPGTLADANGYTSLYNQFRAPLTSDNTCANTVLIFIGNSDSQGPETDTSANTTALSNLGGNTSQLQVPQFTTTLETTNTALGYDATCRSNANQCSTADFATECAQYDSCVCNTSVFTTSGCNGNKKRYQVEGVQEKFVVTPTNTYANPPKTPVNADEWSRFLHQVGVPVSDVDIRQVSTYTIDVFYDHQNADQTALLMSMANVGGGKYFAARSEQAIIDALREIINEIQAVNSTFAAASLPVNATNRAQNENQVFIGMFRPDKQALPRWFGNLKRYQIVNTGSRLDLGDANGDVAISTQTGFLNECATSYWTADSGNYWENIPISPSPMGRCLSSNNDPFSDSPDGPRVEKGGAAQVIRNGNNPPYVGAGANSPTNNVNRTVYTLSGGSLTAFDTGSSGLGSSLVDFTLGKDTQNELNNSTPDTTKTRPSIHGDVIHSRPLPLNYGGGTGVVVYYGANDGTFRAVRASDGKELWAFIAPEVFSTLQRLQDNDVKISFPGNTTGTPAPEPKDYQFDGSTGVFQSIDNSNVWIYPTMRRGGRMVYAMNVTNPASPAFMWRAGCPNLDNDTGCTSGMSSIGQTWSRPSLVFIKGYSESTPVAVFGGGHDNCEDADTADVNRCSNPKGSSVFVLNGQTGVKVAEFDTEYSVIGDIPMIDANLDGKADYAYAADMGGNIYRISFADPNASHAELAPGNWTILKVAETNTPGHKFQYGPALLHATNNIVYLALGTGDREHPLYFQYPKDVTNRFYVFKDDLQDSATVTDLNDSNDLADYTMSTDCDDERILPGSSKRGWFMDLLPREQTVTSAVISAGQVVFSTNQSVEPEEGTCVTNLGIARGYTVDLLNASGAIGVTGTCGGDRSTVYAGAGLPPSPVLATVPIDGVLTTVLIGAPQKDGSVSCVICPRPEEPPIPSPRRPVYWYKSSGID